MGYGGALIWTGLTRNLKARYPDKKVVLVQPKSWRQWLARKKNKGKVIYKNNPDIDLLTDQMEWRWKRLMYPKNRIVVDMTKSAYHYWTYQDDKRIDYIRGTHAIAKAAQVHGIEDPILRPRVELTEEEEKVADDLLALHNLTPQRYIAIEPHTKETFTPNKAWFWDRWQELADRLQAHFEKAEHEMQIVQIGAPDKKILKGVVDLTGKTSFRETGRIIQQAATFTGCVGGLAHLAKAMGTQSVILISGWEPKELASYPDDINLHTDMDCKCFGLKTPCPIGRESMKRISVDDVFAAVLQVLSKKQ